MDKRGKELPMAEAAGSECCIPDPSEVVYEEPQDAGWITGIVNTSNGPIWQIRTELLTEDRWGAFKARWGVGRMNYTVPPGLYAAGEPDSNSAVLVSANYKLSFDYLRRELGGLNLWILVLDTRGINVWCAAGKGSFGTAELLRMVRNSQLSQLVTHRQLILPQLAAPGIEAHKVRKECGFKVVYGPVRAADIPVFLSNNNKADPEMRHPKFSLLDRLVLTPVELTALVKPLALAYLLFLVLNLISALVEDRAPGFGTLLSTALLNLTPFIAACLVGAVLVPALLPYLPGRALAWKGWLAGMLWASAYLWLIVTELNWLYIVAIYLTLPSISAFLGMNFTGSTTYTSLSGVVREMGYALPLIIISSALGLIALSASYFI